MSSNDNLHKAKNIKNDEFYTLYEDIKKEVMLYKESFADKVVYCNCDNAMISNFYKFFRDNFKVLKLKKLIVSSYSSTTNGHKLYYDGNNVSERFQLTPLIADGDFRSDECANILKAADIIVTNPPFSLFREYVKQLINYEKKFLIIGPKNAITYKEFFPLIKDNKVWLGYHNVSKFMTEENVIKKFGNIGWYTNLHADVKKESLILTKRYYDDNGNPLPGIEKVYPKYDNFDAINVDKVCDIPCDYDGVMGVPITFLDKYNSSQFDIVKFRKGNDDKDLTYKVTLSDAETDRQTDSQSVTPYFRILIKYKNRGL